MTRRKFGTIKHRKYKGEVRYLTASYPTPPDAYDRWPDLPERQSRTFRPEEETQALAWLDDARKRIDAGLWQPDSAISHERAASTITVGEYWPIWLDQKRKKDGQQLRESTIAGLRRVMEHHVLPTFRRVRLVDVTQRMVDRWLDGLQVGDATKYNAFKPLRAMLKAASQPGADGTPPILARYPLTHGASKPQGHELERPATPQEVQAIYQTMPERYRMAIYLTVFADGLRIGEVCALQRGDIDLETRTLHVRRTRLQSMSTVTGPLKTASSKRDIRLPRQLMPDLVRFLDDFVAPDPDAWLFTLKHDTSIPIAPNSLRGYYDVARRAAGRPDLRYHDLRHTALTWLAGEGATLREIMDCAGHADVDTAMRYQHAVDERRDMLADAMGDRMVRPDTPEGVMATIRDLDERIGHLEQERAEMKRHLADLLARL